VNCILGVGEETLGPVGVAAAGPPSEEGALAKPSAGAHGAPPFPKSTPRLEAPLEERRALEPDVANAIAKMFKLCAKKNTLPQSIVYTKWRAENR
jgi:hypothetical protein